MYNIIIVHKHIHHVVIFFCHKKRRDGRSEVVPNKGRVVIV